MLNRLNISLRVSILSLFVSLFVATILTIITVTTLHFYDTQLVLSKQQMDQVTSTILRKIDSQLNPAEQNALLTGQLIQKNILIHNNNDQMMLYTIQMLKSINNAAMVYWGDSQGNFVIARRDENHAISSEIIDRTKSPPTKRMIRRDPTGNVISDVTSNEIDYDPRLRPWYRAAVIEKGPTWSNAYVFFSGETKSLGITSAVPVLHADSSVVGVVGIDMRLDALSEFLAQQQIGIHGIAFIVDPKGNLIAHPDLVSFEKKSNDQPVLTNIKKLPDTWVSNGFTQYEKLKKNNFSFRSNKETYLASFQPIPSFKKQNWRVGIVVPEDDFVGELKRANFMTIQICLVILTVGIVLITMFSKKISQSLRALVQATEKIKNFDLSDTPPISSHIREITFLSNAISAMRTGLRAFQKYVPADLVRILIRHGKSARLGGNQKTITIMFSDIKDFTSISEQLPPQDLMLHLCDYLDHASEVIRHEKGTIDKYIGDAIMAFWNSPSPDKDHTLHACLAGLRLQKKLIKLNKHWEDEGKPPFYTRIGIHTGEAIVGNLGSKERLNYTAIGDTINVASRLEMLNKVYGTSLIVSDSVKSITENHFIFRVLDLVAVKGKKESTMIYEIISERTEELDQQKVRYYESFAEALKIYQSQDWDKALEFYATLKKQQPEDPVVNVFIKRCQIFKENPPPSDWDGVWRYTTKGKEKI